MLREADSAEACLDPTSTSENEDDLDRWQRFHEEVEKLPTEEREVVGLRFYHGWGEAEIAELFGVTERTVRRRWAAGCAAWPTFLAANYLPRDGQAFGK